MNAVTTCAKWSPLHLAADNGHVDVAKVLVQYGANVDAVDRHGRHCT